LNGCPYGKIWNTGRQNGVRVEYRRGLRVVNIGQVRNSFEINAMNKSGYIEQFGDYDRIFLATASIESFRILATSGFVPKEATLLDSQTFFTPILLSFRYGEIENSYYTLSQAFAYLKNDSTVTAQIQIYDYSSGLVDRAKKISSAISMVPDVVLGWLLRRTFIGIGYLSSDDSAQIHLSLDDQGNVRMKRLASDEAKIRKNVRRTVREFQRYFQPLGVFASNTLTRMASAGEGVHFGGWMPMGTKCDELGQPINNQGIHVVDSSVLPTIPPGPITFTVMANAARIVKRIYG
jgi:hypothetical protein